MIDTAEHSDLCGRLRHLLETAPLTKEARKVGERVLNRLSSDIRVVLLGPETFGKDYLQRVLVARALPRTDIRLVASGDHFNFQDADVCLWVTSGFARDEAEQWAPAPDQLKDHSFLVPVADKDSAAARFDAASLSVLGDIAAEEFFGLFPIVIDRTVQDQQPLAVESLLREVANILRLGLQADADNAQMFLKLHQPKGLAQPPRGAAPSRAVAMPMTAPAARGTPETGTEATEVYRKALGALRDRAAAFEPLMSAREDADVLRVLSICEETSAAVADVFQDSPLRDPAFIRIREEMLSAADKIMLMSLEGGVAPAVAAVTTILQIRREMEVQIAC